MNEISMELNIIFEKIKENNKILKFSGNNSFMELRKIREKELLQEIEVNSETFKIKVQESQLVIEQLIWLTNLSANILNTTKSMLLS